MVDRALSCRRDSGIDCGRSARLSFDLLEEIRLLLNLETASEKLLQIVLVGQPELEEKLKRPELRQLRLRITRGRYVRLDCL